MNKQIIFIIGQTAVGKSTTLNQILDSSPELFLLPNRRTLTDDIIIPEIQKDAGKPLERLTDRVDRFAHTKAYREKYGSGMIKALEVYTSQTPLDDTRIHVFDNIRGLAECKAANEQFANARFIFLYAPTQVRLERMLGRQDKFDRANATRLENSSFIENLEAVEGAAEAFDLYEIAKLEATSSASEDEILNAVKIISSEFKNYNPDEAKAYLESQIEEDRFLFLDTSKLAIDDVATKIKGWL